MNTLLRNARENKELKTRELAQLTGIDQALVSKFESGTRKPTKDQIIKLASVLDIDFETLMIAWLKEKILHEIGHEEFALKALKVAEEEINYFRNTANQKVSVSLQKLLNEIDVLKNQLGQYSQFEKYRFTKSSELEYTFESNRLEGNTLTIEETEMVINGGLTIPGKSMREHLEAINHQDAIAYIKKIKDSNIIFNEAELLSIHNQVLRGIRREDTGSYRNVQVTIKESSYIPPQSTNIQKEMKEFFIWYETQKSNLHAVVLAAEVHYRLSKIHPFMEDNGKIIRLIMNMILLKNDYVIANIKGDFEIKKHYHQKLENALLKNNKEDFIVFIAQTEKENLEHCLRIITNQVFV